MSAAPTDHTEPSVARITIRHFWELSRGFKRESVLTLFIFLNGLCLNTFLPLLIGKILAALGRPGQHAGMYVPYLIVVAVIGVVSNYIGFKALFSMQAKAMASLEHEGLDSLLKRSVGFHNNRVAGKLLSDAINYAMAYIQLSNSFMINIIPFVLSTLVGIVIVFINSWILGLLVLTMTIAVVGVSIYQTVHNTENRNQRHEARRVLAGHLADSISNATTVKTFANEKLEIATQQKHSHLLMQYRRRDWVAIGSEGSFRIAVLLSFEIACVVLIIHLVARNPNLLGIGIFSFSYALSLTNKLFDIGNIFRTVEDALMDANDTMRIVTTTPKILDAHSAHDLQITKGAIDVKDLVFYYTDSSKQVSVFNDLNLKIPAGQKVGLVGPSGGGKSTLTRLLLRFEDIQSGVITIDGQNIKTVTQASLRQSIAYVPQEPLLFHRSIHDNIAYGKINASKSEVAAAAQKAYATDFINALPDGYETIVGERGVKLSGGQRQRIAIARAILKNAPILLLDEATSALDSESEAAIQSALRELMNDRTTLVIAHRLSTIQKLDRIIVLEDGKIIEDGTHSGLLKANGLYSRLWQHQSGGFLKN